MSAFTSSFQVNCLAFTTTSTTCTPKAHGSGAIAFRILLGEDEGALEQLRPLNTFDEGICRTVLSPLVFIAFGFLSCAHSFVVYDESFLKDPREGNLLGVSISSLGAPVMKKATEGEELQTLLQRLLGYELSDEGGSWSA